MNNSVAGGKSCSCNNDKTSINQSLMSWLTPKKMVTVFVVFLMTASICYLGRAGLDTSRGLDRTIMGSPTMSKEHGDLSSEDEFRYGKVKNRIPSAPLGYSKHGDDEPHQFAQLHGNREKPLILIWDYLYGIASEGPGPGPVTGGCEFTNDRTQLNRAAAVIFEYTSLNKEEFPWKHYRHPDQVFVARFEESPPTMRHWFHQDLVKFGAGFINWTMTYRDDADVLCSYRRWNHLDLKATREEEEREVEKIVAGKSRAALWLVSNCGENTSPGSQRRMSIVDELVQLGLPVERYGKCFGNRQRYAEMTAAAKRSYKFYLAFENSHHCRDYLTEKFWKNALSEGRVPIVWGPTRHDMERLAPAGSFVHADDFTSLRELVEYVHYLDGNSAAYRKYFEWRLDAKWRHLLAAERELYCQDALCEALRSEEGLKRKSVEDMAEFWYGRESSECMEMT